MNLRQKIGQVYDDKSVQKKRKLQDSKTCHERVTILPSWWYGHEFGFLSV